MNTDEQQWEQILQIKTSGRDDSRSDGDHHPYEATDYCVLERLSNSGYIGKKHTLIDYGSGKGRVAVFMAYQTGCHVIGVEYDERLYERALINGESAAAR
ncbi:MAG: SAM-dependent methyltransferase, partial [Veillonella caviae]|nr:SAM-dependent methyltransferase [Veillonella caviae]